MACVRHGFSRRNPFQMRPAGRCPPRGSRRSCVFERRMREEAQPVRLLREIRDICEIDRHDRQPLCILIGDAQLGAVTQDLRDLLRLGHRAVGAAHRAGLRNGQGHDVRLLIYAIYALMIQDIRIGPAERIPRGRFMRSAERPPIAQPKYSTPASKIGW